MKNKKLISLTGALVAAVIFLLVNSCVNEGVSIMAGDPPGTAKLAGTPSALSATASSSTVVRLTWTDNSATETGFRIERSTDKVAWTVVGTVDANIKVFENTGLTAATKYFYRIRAVNNSEMSEYSNVVDVLTPAAPGPLTAPSGLTATAASSTVIKLTWTDNSTAETGFKIEKSTDNTNWTVLATTAANATVYEASGLTPATKYYFRVRAYNGTSVSEPSNTVDPTTLASGTGLGAPSSLTVAGTTATSVKLTWTDNSDGETGFKIEKSTDNKATWTVVAGVDANVKQYEVTGLTPATRYVFRVRAYNATSFSEYSNLVDPTTLASGSGLAAPTLLTVAGKNSTTVKLSWKDNSEAETGFRIEKSTDNTNWTSIGEVGVNVNNYYVTGLTPATHYFFRVRAFNATTNSDYSNSVDPWTDAANALAAPSNLAAAANSGTVVRLTWTDNSEAETGFKIERSTDKVTWTVVGEVGANVKVFENSGLTPGTTYVYRVRAFNTTGYSEYSNLSDARTVAILAAPGNLVATANSATVIRLTWSDNSEGETAFKIERSTDNATWSVLAAVDANVKVYENSGLTPNTKYYYRVRAVNATTSSENSNVAYTTTLAATLAAPTNLMVAGIYIVSVKLTWSDNSEGELGFKIEKSTDKINWTTVGGTDANVKQYEVTGLNPSTKYYFRVKAYTATVYSEYSNIVDPTTYASNAGLAAPTSLVATVNSPNVIKLTWTDNSEAESGFKIERSADKVTWTVVGEVGANVKVFENSGLTPSTKYYYRVKAFNQYATSDYSNTVDPTTAAAYSLAAPTNLVVTAANSTAVRMTWKDNSTGEIGFMVEKANADGSWTIVGTTSSNAQVFELGGLTSGVKYYFRVRAHTNSAFSEYSNVAYVTMP